MSRDTDVGGIILGIVVHAVVLGVILSIALPVRSLIDKTSRKIGRSIKDALTPEKHISIADDAIGIK